MADYEETRQMETGSGLYKKLTPKLVGVLSVVLWAIVSAFGYSLWNDVKDAHTSIVTLQAQRESDRREFSEIKDSIKDIQADMKEILREMRK
jgi:cell division protein FtsB